MAAVIPPTGLTEMDKFILHATTLIAATTVGITAFEHHHYHVEQRNDTAPIPRLDIAAATTAASSAPTIQTAI